MFSISNYKISNQLYKLLSRKYTFISSLNKLNHRNSCRCYSTQETQETLETQPTQPTESTESTLTPQETRNAKIGCIVDEIAQLNLLEVAQLVSTLKTTLNLPDTAMMGAAIPNSPIAAATTAGTVEEEEPQITQTIFDIVLKAFPTDKKVTVIKEVRAIYKLGLKEAKSLVEKAPCTLQAQAPKVEADEVKQKLEAIGAEIVLE